MLYAFKKCDNISQSMAKIAQKTTLIRAIFVVVAIVFSLILTEILLRIFLPKPENLAKLESSKIFIHENKPNETFESKSEQFGENIQVHTNSFGFRDYEFNSEKSDNTIRIATLGDSFEEATQMPVEYTWPKIMEKNLSTLLGKKVEVYNFGVSGYGTDQEWLTLKYKVLKFKPKPRRCISEL